jgi:AICAR transformylase/IMP cyclohydrolase PurH
MGGVANPNLAMGNQAGVLGNVTQGPNTSWSSMQSFNAPPPVAPASFQAYNNNPMNNMTVEPMGDDLSNCTEEQKRDLLFALKVAKHTKSNTIVLAKNQQLCAAGTGQTSRVDALKQAIEKAQSFQFDLNGAVMASDAFFPFPDCVEIARNAGVNAVIQPGGSVKDQLSIDYCNTHDVAMYLTGIRHFKH